MSRHYIDCQRKGRTVRVTLGYDRPCDRYFMIAQYTDAARRRGSPILYASSNDPNDPTHDLDYYDDLLKKLGINLPGDIFVHVWADAIDHRGNYVVEHFADGRYRVVHDESGLGPPTSFIEAVCVSGGVTSSD